MTSDMSVYVSEGKDYTLLYLLFSFKLLELRLQTKRTTAPIYKKWTTLLLPIISRRLGSARLGSARLGSARLGYIQLIAVEEYFHVLGPVFPAEHYLLRLLLG